jgi:hypothetical protein
MYTFLFVGLNGAIPTFDFETCPDDEAARRTAERLLDKERDSGAVEVWNERERLWVVRRPS